MQDRISNRTVDKLSAEDGREVVLWDSDLKGFGVRTRGTGVKTYIVHYRVGGGRRGRLRKLTIGKHGAWTPGEARKEAERQLSRVHLGIDPAGDKADYRLVPTVAELSGWFIDEHAKIKRKQATADQYQRLFAKFIVPAFGWKKITDVTQQDVMKLHNALSGTPYQANRVLALISTLFTFAERTGKRPKNTNPARHVERYKEYERQAMLSAQEIRRLGEALERSKESPYVVALIRMLLLTGARLGEIRTLKWEWINADRGEATLPDSKTEKDKRIRLAPDALEILARLPRMMDNPYVICGEKPGAHFVGVQRPWQRIRADANLNNLRIHDLRHAFATLGSDLGIHERVIGFLLGHTQAKTTRRYTHVPDHPASEAANSIANFMSATLAGDAGK